MRDGVSKHSQDLISELLELNYRVFVYSPHFFRLRYVGYFDHTSKKLVKPVESEDGLKLPENSVVYVQYMFSAYWLSIYSLHSWIKEIARSNPVIIGLHEPSGEIRRLRSFGRSLYKDICSIARIIVVFSGEGLAVISDLTSKAEIIRADLEIPKRVWSDDIAVERPTILLFGYYAKTKGFEDGLRILRSVNRRTGVRFKTLIVCSLRERKGTARIFSPLDRVNFLKLKALIFRCQTEMDLEFRQYLDEESVPAVFHQSHYLYLPYLDVSNSGVLVLAKQYGNPVICNDLRGFHEALGDGGIYLPKNCNNKIEVLSGIFYEESFSGRHLQDTLNFRDYVQAHDNKSLIEILETIRTRSIDSEAQRIRQENIADGKL